MILVKIGTSIRKLDKSDDIPELNVPNIDSCKLFNPEEILEEDEWFYIVIDEEHTSMITDYSKYFSSTCSTNGVTKSEFSEINLIFKNFNQEIVFQKITKSKRMVDKSILSWRAGKRKAERTVIEDGIELKSECDAYFNGINKLYFKNFRTINGLFKNIDDYYRVANSIEIDNFKQFDIIKFTSDFEIKTNNLRMLALLADDEDLDLSDNSLKSTLLTSYSKYPQQEFKEENGVFIISSNKSLTCFLKLVLGRLYTNPITQHQMEANYAKKLN